MTGITTATVVAAGGDHTCALFSGGAVECWGYNDHGQLGNGTTTDSHAPVPVAWPDRHCHRRRRSHTCALLTNSTVECWGGNTHGQLGNGTTTDSSTPVAVTGITTATAVTAGRVQPHLRPAHRRHHQMLGRQLLRAARQRHHHRLIHPGGGDRDHYRHAVTAGAFHTCALLAGGTVECWG